MKKLWAIVVGAALAALTGSSALPQGQVGPANLITCNQTATMTAGPTTITVLVAPVAGRAVNVCGWHVTNTGASGTFALSAGTQTTTPCDTGTKAITPALSVSSTAPSADHPGYAFFSGSTGQGICVTPSVGTIAVVLFYSLS